MDRMAVAVRHRQWPRLRRRTVCAVFSNNWTRDRKCSPTRSDSLRPRREFERTFSPMLLQVRPEKFNVPGTKRKKSCVCSAYVRPLFSSLAARVHTRRRYCTAYWLPSVSSTVRFVLCIAAPRRCIVRPTTVLYACARVRRRSSTTILSVVYRRWSPAVAMIITRGYDDILRESDTYISRARFKNDLYTMYIIMTMIIIIVILYSSARIT